MGIRTFGVLAMSGVLAAWGGGGGGGVIDPTANIDDLDVRTFAEGNDDFGNAMDNEDVVTTRQVSVSALALDREAGTVTRLDNVVIALQGNGDDGLVRVFIDGNDLNLTSDDVLEAASQASSGFDADSYDEGEYLFFFSSSESSIADALTNGNGFVELFGLVANNNGGTGDDIRARFATGMELEDAEVVNLAGLQYFGFFNMELHPTTGWEGYSTNVGQLQGSLNMEVNLDSNAISGLLSNIEFALPAGGGDYDPVAGTITMDEAEFDVNAFAGTLTASETLITGLESEGFDISGSATYSGAFYGFNGEEVAGALSIDNEDVIGIGHFIGYED